MLSIFDKAVVLGSLLLNFRKHTALCSMSFRAAHSIPKGYRMVIIASRVLYFLINLILYLRILHTIVPDCKRALLIRSKFKN